MTRVLGKARYIAIAVLAIIVGGLFVWTASIEKRQARALNILFEPTPSEVATALLRAGLGQEALAAAGVDRGCIARRSAADDDDRRMLGQLLGSFAAARQERVELPATLQLEEIIGASNMSLTDPDLRHGPLTAALDHLLPALRALVEVDLLPDNPLHLEKRLGAIAEGAVRPGIHQDMHARALS